MLDCRHIQCSCVYDDEKRRPGQVVDAIDCTYVISLLNGSHGQTHMSLSESGEDQKRGMRHEDRSNQWRVILSRSRDSLQHFG